MQIPGRQGSRPRKHISPPPDDTQVGRPTALGRRGCCIVGRRPGLAVAYFRGFAPTARSLAVAAGVTVPGPYSPAVPLPLIVELFF